jgi:hypothetical protein
MFGLGAAPTTDLDDDDVVAPLRNPDAGVTRPLVPAMPGVRPPDRTDTSTGNKNLDLLLELQGRPGEALRQAAPRSAAAASAAAAALADLRAKAAERPATEGPKADQTAVRPVVPSFEGMGTLDVDGRAAPQPTERREWTGQRGGAAAGSTYSPDDGTRSGDRGYDAFRGGYSDDNLLRRLPREVLTFLRENRYWLLGTLGGVALLVAMIKSYSRRI